MRRRCCRRRTLEVEILSSSATSAVVNNSASAPKQSGVFKEPYGAGDLSSPAGISTLPLLGGLCMCTCCAPTGTMARRGAVTTGDAREIWDELPLPSGKLSPISWTSTEWTKGGRVKPSAIAA